MIATLREKPVILIWIPTRPRITTLRPIAERLQEDGFSVVVAYARRLTDNPDSLGFSAKTPCFAIRESDVGSISGVTIFISSEIGVCSAPRNCARVGVYHSLPDHALAQNYADVLKINPVAMANMDYFAVLVQQSAEAWTLDNYRPHVDRILPAAALRGRRKALSIIPFGYPKIDHLMATDTSADTLDTITYAPTNSRLPFGTLAQSGKAILSTLLSDFPDHRIAFRPYPGEDADLVSKISAPFVDNKRFVLDRTPTGEAVTRRTALMVSDRSSVAISFGLGYARPVVFYEVRPDARLRDTGSVPFDPIGVKVADPENLRVEVQRLMKEAPKRQAAVIARRNDFIYNPGRSVGYMSEIMPDIISGRGRAEWLEVPRRPFRAMTEAAYRRQYDRVVEKVAARFPANVEPTRNKLGPAFETSPYRRIRRLGGAILRRTPGLRRYLSRPMRPK
ncbi:hypothetical protein [Jannaschia donghaensis]|nr:hypothetical protein [Jannaschia donghaensis]